MANLYDIPGILMLEERVWPDGLRATEAMLKSRIETFPEGQIIKEVNGKIRGYISTEILEYDIKNPIMTWYEATDNGFIKNKHTIKGNILFGVNLTVWPSREMNVADELILAVGEIIIRFNLEGIVLGARIPRFHKFATRLPVEEYVQTRTGAGRLIDPELHLYSKFGVEILKIIPEYIEDAQSLNYGVIIYWKNPVHRKNSRRNTFSYMDQIHDYTSGYKTRRWTLLLPGAGCTWSKKSGCYMCGFNKIIDEIYKQRQLTTLEINNIYRIGKSVVEEQRPEALAIYNAGSFLNDREIPLSVQSQICEDVAKHPTIEMLMVETRPEFITSEKLSMLISKLQGKRLQLAIGLEVESDFIRKHCINKGFTKRTYEAALKIAKSMGSEVLTYVFLKPLYLSEKEAIDVAIESAKYAFDIGSDAVALEAAFIQEGTVMHQQYLEKRFRPPWLWSILEVVRNCHNLGPMFIGGFDDEPPPIAVPSNCGLCDSKITHAFHKYNETLDFTLLNNLHCSCSQEWKKELLKAYPPLAERIYK